MPLIIPFLEVTCINKQNFLNELGGLLTFMSEEDRLEALTLYEKMFDDTDDEQALIQALRSPTRQAVVIARAYDANARKKRTGAAGQDEEPEATPDFVLAILQVYEEAVPLPLVVAPPVVEPVEEEIPEEPVVIRNQVSLFEEAPEELVVVENEDDSETPEPAEDEADDAVAVGVAEEEESAPVVPVRASLPEAEEEFPPKWEDEEEDDREEGETVTRTKVPLLILFILFAVPVTLLGIALLLIPAVVSLALAAASIAAGCAGIAAAFGCFAMFADILIVVGGSLVALALGLLFLWLFVWFVGGAIVALVRGVIQLGRSWCCEEVPA